MESVLFNKETDPLVESHEPNILVFPTSPQLPVMFSFRVVVF